MQVSYSTAPPTMPDSDRVTVLWKLPGEDKETEVFTRDDGDPDYWWGESGIGLTTEIIEEHARQHRAKLTSVRGET